MAARKQQKGPCFLCGQEMAAGYMGRHLLSKHFSDADDQECCLLRVEDEYSEYWLYLDIPLTSTLSTLDKFLREVWVECCGHLSAFMPVRGYYDDEYSMSTKVVKFAPGSVIQYEYDFGSTTTLYVTFVKWVTRPKQRTAVRVLARNAPYQFKCDLCGKEAAYVDVEEWPQKFYCEACAEAKNYDMCLPVVNSPRMGVCGYTGEFDRFAYDPRKVRKLEK